jgi:lipoate-protein ligase A
MQPNLEWRLLDTGFLSAAENMALDRILLESRADGESPNTLRFLQFSAPSVLVGCHQQLDQEVRLEFCRERGLEVNRRITGGGAILFEPCHIGWEIIASRDDPRFHSTPAALSERFARVFCAALRDFSGIQASFRPRNDIEVRGRKIAGTGGTTEGAAFLFQGTLLVDLDVQTMLHALRVPMEKLNAHEIDSLRERVTTLRAELGYSPEASAIKEAVARAFAADFGVAWTHAPLSAGERERLRCALPEFQSESWIGRRMGPSSRHMLKAIHRGHGGAIHLLLDADAARGRIRSANLRGDFFASPARAVYDLESRFKDAPARMDAVERILAQFFEDTPNPFASLGADDFAGVFRKALDKLPYLNLGFSHEETNDLFPVCGLLPDIMKQEWGWFLLPYCAKHLECALRQRDGCVECSQCSIGAGYGMARAHSLKPVTILNFENLSDQLRRIREERSGGFIGCCCEGFYTKHARDFESAGVPGILVAMDSTTCYDLGKARDAYHGGFQHQTHINLPLLEKVLAVRCGADPLVRAGPPGPAVPSQSRLPGACEGPAGGPAADQGVRPTRPADD